MPGLQSFALALACAATASLASLPPHSYFEARRDPGLPATLSIQAHLEEVENHLRAYAPDGLSDAQAAARAERLDDLRAYRLRGDFPRNLDFPGRVIPYFIDARGIACAVGHLVILSGERPLAEEIARNMNHVYIPEIKDARLSAWAHRNGLTLEECARIQPSYAPKYSDIMGLSIDNLGRPWVATGNGVGASGYVLSHRTEQGWISLPYQYPAAFVQLCMVGENPLVIQGTGFSWKGGPQTVPEGEPMQMTACSASRDGKSFWLGGTLGAHRYVVEGSDSLRLVATVRNGSGAPTLSVTHLAQTATGTWIGTRQGFLNGKYPALGFQSIGSSRLSGLLDGPDQTGVWFGLQGEDADPRFSHYFSLSGILWHHETTGPHRYGTRNYPLPSDTVLMAAAGPEKSIWFTCDGKKLHRFIPPDRLETASFQLPAYTSTLKSDSAGQLFIGTFGGFSPSTTGLFRVTDGALVPLGYPTGPSALAAPRRTESLLPSVFIRGLGLGGVSQNGPDVLGRRSGPRIAAGISVPEPARRD